MSYSQNYLGRSKVASGASGSEVSFSPNLTREKVAFSGELKHSVRFREAMSALHEVVTGDLTVKARDRSALEAYNEDVVRQEQEIYATAEAVAKAGALEHVPEKPPRGLEEDFQKARKRYFKARGKWINDLRKLDHKLWWLLDPVVTVAPDVLLFECFSKDESSYGCLTVDREAFTHQDGSTQALGTTNVDYSLALYEQFQTLRSYRPTQLNVDPAGFEVQVAGHPDFREEKIDLPESWLRGFGQIQAAQMLPATHVRLPRESIYGLLAVLARRREKKGPRAVRFELIPGKPPRVVLEPWEKEVPCHGVVYEGEGETTIRVWGRRRLLVLARLLPLVESVDVYLLGSGLPSVWVARLGEMTFTLALSGWTNNDWTSGANLDLLAGQIRAAPELEAKALQFIESKRFTTISELRSNLAGSAESQIVGAMFQLAQRGQVLFDHAHGVYRYRSVMPEPLTAGKVGVHPELMGAEALVDAGNVILTRQEPVDGKVLLQGDVDGTHCETLLDGDGGFKKARCSCSYFYKNKLRTGPCRHLLALKLIAEPPRLGTGSSLHLIQ